MPETLKKNTPETPKPKTSQGVSKNITFKIAGKSYPCKVSAEWMPLFNKEEKVIAEMYHTAYTLPQAKGKKSGRPLTFIFNGGPGAASAYLHLGAMGPMRVAFGDKGEIQGEPTQLVPNDESWLSFSDLVFIDPIGTGLSRTIPKDASDPVNKDLTKLHEHEKEYFQMNRDLKSIGEFVESYLSKHQRWGDPIYIAGESYGGFRVAKLAKLLQEGFGVGLCGAILISPALEWSTLSPNDYDTIGWVDLFPSMALAAFTHGRSKFKKSSFEKVLKDACEFADSDYATFLLRGDDLGSKEQDRILEKMADFLGLKKEYVQSKNGRIHFPEFCRELLRDQKKVAGFYDATITCDDAFPARDVSPGPDPTLFAIERVFSTGINKLLRQEIGLKTERAYQLLSMEVNRAWKVDEQRHAFDLYVGASDDLRYAMSLNENLKVYLTHGFYDLVTPFHAADRIARLMRLSPKARARLTLKHYEGGHMFYSWDESRKAFTKDLEKFYKS